MSYANLKSAALFSDEHEQKGIVRRSFHSSSSENAEIFVQIGDLLENIQLPIEKDTHLKRSDT